MGLIKLLLPVAVIYFAFKMGGVLIGLLSILAVIAFVIYKNWTTIYILKAKNMYLKDTDKMFELLEKAYKTGNMLPDHKIYYGYMCLREGRYADAERLLNSAMAFQKDEGVLARAKTNIALLEWKKGNIDKAIEIMDEIYKVYKSSVVYGNYGYLLMENNQPEKALEVNLEAYDYDSTNDLITDNLAQNYYMLGDFEKSKKYAQEVIERNPQFPMPYYNFAKALNALGEKEKACEMLKKALTFPFTGVAAITKEDVENLLNQLEGTV